MNTKIIDNIDEIVLEIAENLTIKDCNKPAQTFFERDITGLVLGEVLHVQGISNIVKDILENKRNIYESKFTKRNNEFFLSVIVEPPFLIIRNRTSEKVLKQAKIDFVNLMVHEFSTPLTVLEGHIALLNEKIGDISPDISNSLYKITKSIKRLSRLIEQLSVISSMELKDYEVKKETVHLNHLIEEIIEVFKNKIEAKSIKMENNISENVYLDVDSTLLYRCLENILSNAIKYSYENGTISIYCTDKDDKALVTVEDEGIGINRDEMNRIFERFYRGREALKKGSTGLGLGLSLVKHSLKLLNSEIDIKSKHLLGTKVIISIPK
ncbi:MAG: HAMP domain-containing sensor histidine kinase [Kosmotogaceae bacterium]